MSNKSKTPWVDSVLAAKRLNLHQYDYADIGRTRALFVHCNVMGATNGSDYETAIRKTIADKYE